MKEFWKLSPEWQRQEELLAELDAAKAAKEEAGGQVLSCVRVGIVEGAIWETDRNSYLDAVAAWQDAFVAWRKSRDAFEASPAGKAYARYLDDPRAFLAAEAAESEAA